MGIFRTNPVFYLSFISALKCLITEQDNSKHFTYVQIYEYTQTTYTHVSNKHEITDTSEHIFRYPAFETTYTNTERTVFENL